MRKSTLAIIATFTALVTAAFVIGLGTSNVGAASAEVSLWPNSATPAVITDPDTSGIELGTKFSSSVAGTVNGVEFYKGPQNTGTHTGSLWNSSGTKLASVVFTGETASGWQSARFSSPVHIAAGSSYTISYHAPVARYSSTGNYFKTKYTSGVLSAPVNAGVYKYGTAIAFPTSTYQYSNYWVDVLFTADEASPSPSASATASPTNSPSPSVSPSVTPSSSPTPPNPGAYPNPSNTGVPAGTVLTLRSGDVSLGAGQVLDSVHVTGSVTVTGAGARIQNSQIDGYVQNVDSRPSFSIVDSQVGTDSCNSYGNGAIGLSNYTALRVKLLNFPDGFRVAGGNVNIQDSYAKTCGFGTVHSDGLQMYGAAGGSNIVIRHNTIDNRNTGENAAIFLPGDGDRQGNNGVNVTDVSDNVLAGGGYTLYVPGPGSPITIQSIANNHVVNNTWEYNPYGVYCAYVGSFTGNEVVTYDFATGAILSHVRTVSC